MLNTDAQHTTKCSDAESCRTSSDEVVHVVESVARVELEARRHLLEAEPARRDARHLRVQLHRVHVNLSTDPNQLSSAVHLVPTKLDEFDTSAVSTYLPQADLNSANLQLFARFRSFCPPPKTESMLCLFVPLSV